MTQPFAGPQVHWRNYEKHKESRFHCRLDRHPIHCLVHVRLRRGASPESPHEEGIEDLAYYKTAKEPPEHLRIAVYYRQEAARLTASSKEHAELALTYAKTVPHPMVSKHGDSFGLGAPHCKKWAELQAEEAKEAEALATLHEDMAKAAEQKQP